MDILRQRPEESTVVPPSGLIWPLLVLFLLGTAICSFNPPVQDGQDIVRKEYTMNAQTKSSASESTGPGSDTAPLKTETATFALG